MRNAYKRLLAAVLTLVILLALVPVIAKNNEHVATEPSSPERLAAEPSAVDVEEQEPRSQASSDAEKTAVSAELLNNNEASEEVLPPEIEEDLQSSLSADSVSPEELYTETLPIEDIPQTSQADTAPCDADFNELIQSSQVADYKNLTFCIEDGKAVIRNYATDEVHDVAVENATALAVNGHWLFAAEGNALNAYRLPEMTRNGVLTSDHEIEQFYIENGKAYFVSNGNIYVQPLEAAQAQLLYDGGNAVSIYRYSEDKLTFRTDDPMNDASEQTHIDETVEQEETSFLVNLSDGSVEGLNAYEKSLPDRSKKMNWNDGHSVRVGNVTLPLPEYPNGSACTTTGYACTSAHNACRRYYTYNGRTVDTYGWQCCGFARYVFWRCFGVVDFPEVANGNGYYHAVGYVPSGSVSVNYLKSIFGSRIKPGAHIRSNNGVDGWPHSLAFAGCDANYVWTYEGNYNGRCQVSMARRTWAEMAYFLSRTKYGIEYIDMPRNYPESDPLPQAAVDGVTGGLDQIRVWGWAFDKSNVGKALYVDVYVNGKGVCRMTANKSRPDLQTAFGVGNNHGFDETIAIDGFSGNVKVDVYAIGINARGDVDNRNTLITKYVNVSTEPKPESSLDVMRAGQNDVYVKGWAFDRSKASAPLKIDVYVNDKKFTTITANKSRPDVGKNYPGVGDSHGFEETIALPGVSGNTKVELRAINIDEKGNPRGKNNRTVGSARWLPLNPVSDLNESGIFRILSSSNRGFGLDVEGPSVENGANIHAWEVLRDNKNQMFRFVRTSDGYYNIRAVHSGKSVDIYGNGTAEDTNVQQFEVNGSDAQKFTVVHNSNDTYSFYSKTTGKCIDLANGKAANGTNIRMHTANGSAAESFYLEEVKPFGAFDTAKADQISGEVAISGWAADWSAPKTSLEIHVYADGKRIIESKASGTRDDIAKMNAALGAAHGFYEKFTLQPGTHKVDVYAINIDTAGKKVGTSSTHLGSKTVVVGERDLNEGGIYRILSSADRKYGLDVDNAGKKNGVNIHLWESGRDNKHQMFRLVRTSDGYYNIRAVHSGMGVDIAANNTAEDTNVQQYNAYNGDSQKFIVGRNANGTYSFYSKTSGKCIDVAGGKAANGTNVRMHTANGSPAQCFYLEEVTPFGYFDTVSANQLTGEVSIKGWAADWSSPKTSLQIHVYLDGKRVHMATADEKRDDIAKANAELGAMHGYLEKFTAQPGTHKVEIYAINIDAAGKEVGSGNTLIGTKTVVVGEKDLNVNGVYRIRSSVDKKFGLDVEGPSVENGANIHLWEALRDNKNQMFRLVSTPDGYYNIRIMHSGKAVDIKGNATAENTNVQQHEVNTSDAQKFTIGRNANGTYSFYSKTTGKCIDVENGKAANGTNVRMHEANNSAAESFYLEEVTPFGGFDAADVDQLTGETTVGGWAADWSAPKTALKVQVYVDGKLIQSGTADKNRDDIAKISGLGGAHGFYEKFTVEPGTHKIEVYAVNIDAAGKEVGTGNTLIGTKTVMRASAERLDGTYNIALASEPNYMLDVNGASTVSDANIQLFQKNNAACQMFAIRLTSDGYYTITAVHSGQAVDIANNGTADGTNIRQHPENGSDAQKFLIMKNADGSYTFVGKTSGKCMDAQGGKGGNGVNIQLYTANGTSAQKFKLIPAEAAPQGGLDEVTPSHSTSEIIVGGWAADYNAPKSAIQVQVYLDGKLAQTLTADKNRNDIGKNMPALGSAHGYYVKLPVQSAMMHKVEVYAVNVDASGKEVGSGNKLLGSKTVAVNKDRFDGLYNICLSSSQNYVLDVNNASKAEDANIQLWTKNNSACQAFNITMGSDGFYTITAVHSNRAVDIDCDRTANGTNIRQHSVNNTDAQKFLIVKNSDGSVTFFGKTSGKCMDAQGGKGGNGVNIQLYDSNGSAAQKFVLREPTILPSSGADNGSAGSYSGGMAGTGKVLAYGLDVSEHQGVGFNFQNVKNAGYSYVILRCGFVSRKDYRFEEYYNAARQAGLNIGVYFYSYATNAAAASREADLCLSYIKGKKFEYPVYFDFEDPSANSRNGNTAYSICRAFMDKVSAAGYLTGLYGYAGWMDAQNYGGAWVPIDSICGNKYELWMANYYDSNGAHFRDNYSRRFGMYQYTSTNVVNGRNVDTNMCFKDYPSIVKKYGFNGYTRTEHAPQGAMDGANGGLDTVTVWGWAFDYSNCGKALYVDIYVNGKPIKRITANKFRQDIQNWGNAGSYHGFHEDLSLNGFSGNVKIDAYAIGIDSNGKLNNNNVLIGTKYANVTTEPKPESKLDEIKSNQDHIYVRGWAFDKSKADAALQIDVYVNDKKFTTITANKSRPDVGKAHSGVGNNHGFEETITLPGVSGNTKVELRAINIDEKGNPRGTNDQSIGGARYLPLDPVTDLNESGVFRILSAADRNYGLDVAGGAKNNGANIQIWSTSRDSRNQMFRFERTSDGYYSIRAMHSGMGVDITANNTAEDTNVQQYNAYNGDSQKFTVVRNANGTYSFYSKTSGRCIDVDCGKAANGTNVRMHSANGSAAESFYLEEVTPFGYLDTVTTDQLTGEISVKGWAADWSAPKTALQIHVYMDGQLVHKATAGVSRDDVMKQNADLGAAHGYLEKFAAQPGSHKIEVYAINIDAAGKEVGSGNTLLGTKTVVIGEQDLNEDGIFRILSSVDKKFGLDIEGPSKENGANIHLWEALRDNKNQMFRFERTADGYYNIRIMHSGKVVDVKDGSTAENANVQQFDANNSDAQKFAVVRNANGTYSFYNKTTGKCIDVDSGKAVNGTNVRMHEANNSAAESFYLEEVVPFGGFDAATADAITGDVSISGWAADWSAPKTAVQIQVYMDGQLIHKMAAGGSREDIAKANADLGDAHGFYVTFQVQPGAHKLEVYAVNIDANGKEVGSGNTLLGTKTVNAPEPELNVNGIYRIRSAVDRKYGLDVAANSKASGANICLWEAYRDGKNQMFRLVRTADGYYSFRAVHSGMGIDITANDTAENTNVRQFNAYDGDSQKFRIVRNANGTYTFYSKTSGKCIEIADGKAENGTNVRMHSASGSPAQCFYLEEVTPFGVFDEVTMDAATGEVLLKGWAADWSAAKKSLQIQIFVDGQLVKTTLAGTNRDDVEKKTELGTAHGFLEKLTLQPGSHKIEVYAVNVNAAGKEVGSGNTLLGTQTITVAQVTK